MEVKNLYKKKIDQLVAEEKKKTSSSDSQSSYSKNHSERFSHILKLAQHLKPDPDTVTLDIGRSELTFLLRKQYKNVISLGLPLDLDDGGHREVSDISDLEHIDFDLNKSDDVNLWPEQYHQKFDLIVFSETVEHLHIAPEFCLIFLHYFLKENGKIILTTPNAASIYNRVRLLFGVHPYEKIRYYKMNPGHFREYTLSEMKAIGRAAELDVIQEKLTTFQSVNPFESFSAFKYVLLKPFEFIPNCRDYMVVVFEKSGS